MEKIKRPEISPQVPRIPKPQDIYSRYQMQRPSKEEEKRVEHNYFMRRRGHKNSDISDPEIFLPDDSKETLDIVSQTSSNVNSKPEEKKRSFRSNQPRQKPQEKKEPINLNNLTNIVMEMKEMLNNMPNIQDVLNKSHEPTTKKNATVTPKNRTREISLHDKSIRKSMKLKNYIMGTKPPRRLMSSKGPRPTTTQKLAKHLPVLKNKASDDMAAIQNYFLEFHAKSKFLLKNLEKSVLGDNKAL